MAEIEIDVCCEKCGQSLDVIVKRGNEVIVTPCDGCIQDSYNEGFNEGRKDNDS